VEDQNRLAIERWSKGALAETEAARVLLAGKQYRQCLFWAHLAVEKALKAHVVKAIDEDPPFIHSLPRLASLAKLSLDPAQEMLLDQLNGYQRLSRYDDPGSENVFLLDPCSVAELVDMAEELVHWLIRKL